MILKIMLLGNGLKIVTLMNKFRFACMLCIFINADTVIGASFQVGFHLYITLFLSG